MKKPTKPTKPRKPKIPKIERQVTDRYYAWYVGGDYDAATKTWSHHYDFTLEDYAPMVEEGGEFYPNDDFVRAEDVPLNAILVWLQKNGIDAKDVVIDNQTFYRKNNGQILLAVSRTRSDEECKALADRNEKTMSDYQKALQAHPEALLEYEQAKKQYEIWITEKRLKELKNS